MQGRIKFYNEKEGYGFIQGEDSAEYYFTFHEIKHFTSVPKMADPVSFDVSSTKQNEYPVACGVNVLNSKELANEKDNYGSEQKVTCPNCHRNIVPRITTLNGVPVASYCPFCGKQVKEFKEEEEPDTPKKAFLKIILSLVTAFVFFAWLFNKH